MKAIAPKLPGALALALSALATPTTAQDRKPDPIVEKQIEMLEDALADRKGEQDAQAITLLKELQKVAPKMVDSDLRDTAKVSQRALFVRKSREPGSPLYLEAAKTLGLCGSTGARVLVKAAEHKRFEDDQKALAAICEAIGHTEDPRQVDYLLETARRSPKDHLMAAAGGALRFFDEAPIKLRRDIVDQMLVTYGEVHTKATDPHVVRGGSPQDFTKQNAENTLRAIEAPWTKTLQSLTGQSFRNFTEWQRWQNKNPDWQ